MKRVFAVLMGSAVLALVANRADAVAYAPGQPGERGAGFERWDANGDGVIDKAEFREMRKAMRKAHQADGEKADAERPPKGRRGDARRPRRDGSPLDGPKARPGDDGIPPHRGPAMHKDRDDDGPPDADRPRRDREGRGRRGPDAKGPREGRARRPGPGFAERRGGKCCPDCECPCCRERGRDRGPADFGRRGPGGPEFGAMGPAHRRGPGRRGMDGERGRGRPEFHRGGQDGPKAGPRAGACPFCEMMMRAHGGPMPFMQHRGGPGLRDFAMRGRAGRFAMRGFAHPGRRFGRRGREIGQRLFERFDKNDDNFITPDEFPGRPEGFDRWDANDDGRIGKKEFKRDVKRHRQEMRRGERGERGRRGHGDRDDDMPRGPRAERTRAI